MRSNLCLISLFSASVIGDFAAGHVVRSAKCDVSQAYSILETLSTGASFCSSYIHVSNGSTKSKTTTVVVTGDCTSATKTKTEHATFTTTVYGKTTTLPVITMTEYSSTVLIPSGSAPSINKRFPASATPDSHPVTATALTDCASQTISSACSSLVCPTTTTVTITITSTKIKKCSDTATITTTITDHTATSKIPFLVSPPPIILSSPGVLTTTVPAVCASTPYDTGGNGVGNNVIPVAYPYFPQTLVECCIICFGQENCVASAVIISDNQVVECDLLIHVDGTQPGANGLCPLGIQDYPFGSPQPTGVVFPGPCGV